MKKNRWLKRPYALKQKVEEVYFVPARVAGGAGRKICGGFTLALNDFMRDVRWDFQYRFLRRQKFIHVEL